MQILRAVRLCKKTVPQLSKFLLTADEDSATYLGHELGQYENDD